MDVKQLNVMNETKRLALIMQAKMLMSQLKAALPQDGGDGVILTDAQFFEPQLTIQITATISFADEIEADEKEDFVEVQKGMICMGLCNDASTIEFLDNEFKFRYVYYDTNGNVFSEIDITKDVFCRTLQEINETMREGNE